MESFLSRLHGDEVFVLAIVVVGSLVGLIIALTAVLASNWRRVRQLDVEGALKQDMLQRGLSAEDIERVIRASSVVPEKTPVDAAGPFADAAATAGLKELTDKQLQAKVASDLAVYEMDRKMMEEALDALGRADLDTQRAVAQAVGHMIENGAEHEQIHAAVVKLCGSSRANSADPSGKLNWLEAVVKLCESPREHATKVDGKK
jgi:hypothetical protein